ncbi:5-(carboxyamino)imidazole ribonucleotide synthase [secondary endosymbiont of Ctenarytaina eucalypti]|uniref:N5-carboxyaminoimidazole ribonucleotide synthase n=1 Tax=secondary endosymbiont of Ctenarytaina eucalypti TaxID=1199245 RepID=J3VST7_9ENTR|nr:5-(carboxyamino)imidazole ribonucleotide synthase [secondary endosymbiont of Ctenarytaina eucalypti]AFP85016.1 phosphoribosylaminoimidazole carboxylase, PurK protein [secondary endosymbiont of Ctenarytaina eucalypti]
MKPVYVLGTGQLGRMLRQAGEPLGITVCQVGIDAAPSDIPFRNAVITNEIEQWSATDLTRKLTRHPNFINRHIFPRLADRLMQKQFLDQLCLSTAPWVLLIRDNQWPEVFISFDDLAIVKRREGSYDGRGQWQIKPGWQDTLPQDCYGHCIVEKGIHFDEEVSLVGARSADGTQVFYPLTYNFHQTGILRASVAFPLQDSCLQTQAENMLSRILDELEYVGVMAMECFIVGKKLIINELAPRVHNSGHWTQNGASISQFELHLRAILELPLPIPVVSAPAAMVNIIGNGINTAWLEDPLVHLHWYDKEVYAGRKVGHVNLTHPDRITLSSSLQKLAKLLPKEYQPGVYWAKQKQTG